MRSDWTVDSPDFTMESTDRGISLRQHNNQSSIIRYKDTVDDFRLEMWRKMTAKGYAEVYVRLTDAPYTCYLLQPSTSMRLERIVNGNLTVLVTGAPTPNASDGNWHGYRWLVWTEINYVRLQFYYYETSEWVQVMDYFDPIGSGVTQVGDLKIRFRDTWSATAYYDDIKIEELVVTGP